MVYWLNMLTLKLTIFGYFKNGSFKLQRLGTEYGGWWIPSSALESESSKVLVSVGLGYDVSFDSELISRGFRVIGLDQQVECVTYAQNEISSRHATFICKGLGVESGQLRFFAPRNPLHDSWSITNAQNTNIEQSRIFEVLSFAELCDEYPEIVNSNFSMLKMDIEGAELPILNAIYPDLAFDFIGVEMDCLILIPFLNITQRLGKMAQVRTLISKLKLQGYALIHLDNFNFFLMKIE
jgi:FkbM family methyltransferase